MKQLKYFVGGIMFFIFVIPISNKILELLELWIDAFKIAPNKRILNYQKDSTILQEFLKEPEEIDDYIVEYEDDDD